jgi:hypothetical protein
MISVLNRIGMIVLALCKHQAQSSRSRGARFETANIYTAMRAISMDVDHVPHLRHLAARHSGQPTRDGLCGANERRHHSRVRAGL